MCSILLRAEQSIRRRSRSRYANDGAACSRPQVIGRPLARLASRSATRLLSAIFRAARLGAVAAIAVSAPGVAQQARSPLSETDRQLLLEFSQKSPGELLIKYFERPPYPLFVIRRLIDLADPVVIPALRVAFEQESSDLTRQFLAATLVRLGETDSRYFDYVAQAAFAAAASDLPYRDRPAAETLDDILQRHDEMFGWAQAHNVTALEAIRMATIELPAAVEALGEAADHRSLPILLRGLDSPNVLVVREAAFGLARLHDPTAVQPITESCKRLTPDERPLVAKALLYFEGRAARRAAESMIADPERVRRWRAEVKRNGWRAAMRDRALQ